MRRHQILTGAANSGEHCYAIGSVEGVNFTAYATGCDIVILASNFERVQIIPGVLHGNIQVSCIDCCEDTGKIAASYGRTVYIFEPTPLLDLDSLHGLDYRWYHTGTIKADSEILATSWNRDGSRLLTGGSVIQLWESTPVSESRNQSITGEVLFYIDDQKEGDDSYVWRCLWLNRPAAPVHLIKFSPDDVLFATLSRNDRLVKIWFENKRADVGVGISPKQTTLSYTFTYIAHPRTVTGFSWRKSSKYMPRGSVLNLLITSCKDNICRIWSETVAPDDGVLDGGLSDSQAENGPQRHKRKFLQRLHHFKNTLNRRRQVPSRGGLPDSSLALSAHDLHRFGMQLNSIQPVCHFHLAASINADTDIPLQPAMGGTANLNFVVHWLNNKELHYTVEAEHLIDQLTQRGATLPNDNEQQEHSDETTTIGEVDSYLENGVTDTVTPNQPLHMHSQTMPTIKGVVSDKAKKRRSFLHKNKSVSVESNVSHNSEMSQSTNLSKFPQSSSNKGADGDLNHQLDSLLQDWQRCPDMLFSVHPADGSFLVWLVEWLDEFQPGEVRQPQISFSSRIPHAIPIYDAMTMSPLLNLYCNYHKLDLHRLFRAAETKIAMRTVSSASRKPVVVPKENSSQPRVVHGNEGNLYPSVMMLSKHENGTLNLWQISFADKSKFGSVLSITHSSRACGHRFRTVSATCHPVLPLLLTTSHHNLPESSSSSSPMVDSGIGTLASMQPLDELNFGKLREQREAFCSELILWNVEPVGPLSKSGGISELARISSPEIASFSLVAWLPTLLPSSTLGQNATSPSALFVASDGHCLRVYQAVIDARCLLGDAIPSRKNNVPTTHAQTVNSEPLRIISQQSTARPGCIIELDPVTDATQDWKNIQLIHVFQDQLVTGAKMAMQTDGPKSLEAIVNLQHVSVFEEVFYLVVIEKVANGPPLVHMWRIVIASQAMDVPELYSPDVVYTQEDDASWTRNSSRSASPEPTSIPVKIHTAPKLSVTTSKVCTQELALPSTVQIVHATVAAGHLSSSSIYPACFAPYLLSTTCTDGSVRFWHCAVEEQSVEWREWEMMIQKDENSSIRLSGSPITVSCAYSGRVAVAYKKSDDNPNDKFVNLCVSIFECESTGGSEWTLEDTIELKNVITTSQKANLDLTYIYGRDNLAYLDLQSTTSSNPLAKQVAVPSPRTIQSVRRQLSNDKLQMDVLQQRHLVQLDWVSIEDGSHILTVAVGSKVLMYAAISQQISEQALSSGRQAAATPSTGALWKGVTMTASATQIVESLRWMKIRSIDLTSADGLPPLPMHVQWARDGLLVVGMDNEMHIYSQWQVPPSDNEMPTSAAAVAATAASTEEEVANETDVRAIAELNVSTLTASSAGTKSLKLSPSVSVMKLAQSASSASLSMLQDTKKDKRKERSPSSQFDSFNKPTTKKQSSKDDSINSVLIMNDCGLYEAARLASPVLPQYHPTQLLELLNFGKIRRVKAILAHLVRCISGSTQSGSSGFGKRDNWKRMSSRRLSSSGSPSDIQTIPEETAANHLEILSIPPLPLYALLLADDDTSSGQRQAKNGVDGESGQDYSMLLGDGVNAVDELDDPFTNDDTEGNDTESNPRAERTSSTSSFSGSNLTHFGPNQARILTRHLTHTHLPGLSNLDQMYLLALADTVANTKVDFNEQQTQSAARKAALAQSNDQPTVISTRSLDDCGLKYLLSARHYIYLTNTLPLRQRAQMQGLSPAYYIWAFHSDAEEDLLSIIPSWQRDEPTWAELRQFGVGWWMRNVNTIRKCAEKVAKAAFQANKDPMDAALLFLAMKKKTLLWGLYRSIDDKRMVEFFKNNFSEDRWRKAALKNAYSLLGRQRFHHAAAFFLLAGALKDAIEILLHSVEDLQLALIVARLYDTLLDDTMPGSVISLLNVECLGRDADGMNYDPSKAHPDPFVRSMAAWLLKDYHFSLSTLLDVGLGSNHRVSKKLAENYSAACNSFSVVSPSVFNFYNYLRKHPLLLRHHLVTTASSRSQTTFIPGFTRTPTFAATAISTFTATDDNEKNMTFVDCITPVERRLYFTTAASHFRNGCPALALEVLAQLPSLVDLNGDLSNSASNSSLSKTQANVRIEIKSPTSPKVIESASALMDDSLDWSRPISKFDDEPLVLTFDDDGEKDEDDSDTEDQWKKGSKVPIVQNGLNNGVEKQPSQEEGSRRVTEDIMAQQLKFIACLKIMMVELSTLATGFEVDGGQLRYQLYVWLENEVEVLHRLCQYGSDTDREALRGFTGRKDREPLQSTSTAFVSSSPNSRKTLHEVLVSEKLDFDAKLERLQHRRMWLKANEQLLRTLLSYSVLHGSGGGGLASVRMELLLLLLELQQEQPHRQLASPLPFPTTLPLLSASIASARTIIADPIRHLQGTVSDMVQTIIEFKSPPNLLEMLPTIVTLRDLSTSLAACIYQCLCDSDSFGTSLAANNRVDIGMEGFASTGIIYKDAPLANVQKQRRFSAVDETTLSAPSKWPGVSSLRSLLAREKDISAPKLNVLLTESLVAIYLSLLIHALCMYDANILYRLVGHSLVENTWRILFGGGMKKLVKLGSTSIDMQTKAAQMRDENTKQRMKLQMKALPPQRQPASVGSAAKLQEDKPTYKETFIAPEISMVSYFMTKPNEDPNEESVGYDSSQSISGSDDEDLEENSSQSTQQTEEHLDPNSYSWCILRFATLRLIRYNIISFLPVSGLELPELPIMSPLLQSMLKVMESWEKMLASKMDLFSSPPPNYCNIETNFVTTADQKLQALLNPNNTPFTSKHVSALPAKRLWHYLVRKKYLQDVFFRYVFRKKRPEQQINLMSPSSDVADSTQKQGDPMKIVHKEQDVIVSFCLNQVNMCILAVATQKDVAEVDIKGILHPPVWLEDETEYDIEVLKSPLSENKTSTNDFLLIQTPTDRFTYPESVSQNSQTGRGSSMILKRPLSGVRRMAAHPNLPYYLVGCQDGSVRLFEWTHPQHISVARQSGSFPKVTRVLFNSQGNKFGVSDAEGSICLWQSGLSLSVSRPFLNLKCHSKSAHDFVFIASSSLIATAGHSTESRNICLWDTLQPQRTALIQAFQCHADGSTALLHAPRHQALISCGKKGEICIFDIRQRQLRHTFQAHDGPIKCLALDPMEEYFASGAADGDIKVWNLSAHNLMQTFPAEHAKSSLFHNVSSGFGVAQLYITDDDELFSCGADGTLRLRRLPSRRGIVQSLW